MRPKTSRIALLCSASARSLPDDSTLFHGGRRGAMPCPAPPRRRVAWQGCTSTRRVALAACRPATTRVSSSTATWPGSRATSRTSTRTRLSTSRRPAAPCLRSAGSARPGSRVTTRATTWPRASASSKTRTRPCARGPSAPPLPSHPAPSKILPRFLGWLASFVSDGCGAQHWGAGVACPLVSRAHAARYVALSGGLMSPRVSCSCLLVSRPAQAALEHDDVPPRV